MLCQSLWLYKYKLHFSEMVALAEKIILKKIFGIDDSEVVLIMLPDDGWKYHVVMETVSGMIAKCAET